MAEAEPTAIIKSGIITNLSPQCLNHPRHRCRALSPINLLIVNRIFLHQLIIMASWVNGRCNIRKVAHLLLRNAMPKRMNPLRVVDNLFRHHQRLTQLCQHITHLMPQMRMVHNLLAGFLVMPIGGTTVNKRIVPRLISGCEITVCHGCLRRCIGSRRCIIVPGCTGSLVNRIDIFQIQFTR